MGNVFIVPVSLLPFNVLNALEQIVGTIPEYCPLKYCPPNLSIREMRFIFPLLCLSGPLQQDAMENYYPVVYLQEHKKK